MSLQRLARDSAYNEAVKREFHSKAGKVLRKLAKLLRFAERDYDLRHNQGGIAVSGEVTLHSDRLYVQVSDAPFGVLWRSCEGRKDYCGAPNQWAAWETFEGNLAGIAERMREYLDHNPA